MDTTDYVLMIADITKHRFVVYDNQHQREVSSFEPQVDHLKTFLADYFDNFKLPVKQNGADETEEDDMSTKDFTEALTGVENWPLEAGLCLKKEKQDL